MRTLADQIGIGTYTPAEAALYARVPRKMMSRWVFGDIKGQPVIDRQIVDPAEKTVTFLDFIQALAVREVRIRHGLSLQKIRQGVDAARGRYGIKHPLAMRHTIYLFSDQAGEGHGEILIRLPVDEEPLEEHYVQLTGRAKGSLMLRPVVELFLDDLQFDPATGLASRYAPMSHKGASIVLDPRRFFGEPTVDPGGYTAATLWDATNIEGGIREAAEAYGVGVAEVELANKYYDSLIRSRVG